MLPARHAAPGSLEPPSHRAESLKTTADSPPLDIPLF